MAKKKKGRRGRRRKYVSVLAVAGLAAAAVDLGILAPGQIPSQCNQLRGVVGSATNTSQGLTRAIILAAGMPLLSSAIGEAAPQIPKLPLGRFGVKL